MSIISEALKKVEKSPEGRPQLLSGSSGRSPWFGWGAFFVGLVMIGMIIAKVVFRPALTTTIPIPTATPANSQTSFLSETPQSSSKGIFPALTKSAFQLTGIAMVEGSGFAIINGDVFQEGDKIQGAKLIKITQDEVTLNQEGKEIRLSLK